MSLDPEFRWAPGWEAPLEEWSIPRLFGTAARLVGMVGSRRAERHGLSAAGFVLLRTLAAEDGLSAGEVARRCWTSPASVTSVVDTLEREGHVQRRRDDGDRRVVRVHITESGLAVARASQQEFASDMRRLYDFIDPADEPAIHRFLVVLVQRLAAAAKEEEAHD